MTTPIFVVLVPNGDLALVVLTSNLIVPIRCSRNASKESVSLIISEGQRLKRRSLDNGPRRGARSSRRITTLPTRKAGALTGRMHCSPRP